MKYGISVLKEMEIVYEVDNNVDVAIVIRSNGIDVQTLKKYFFTAQRS